MDKQPLNHFSVKVPDRKIINQWYMMLKFAAFTAAQNIMGDLGFVLKRGVLHINRKR